MLVVVRVLGDLGYLEESSWFDSKLLHGEDDTSVRVVNLARRAF